AGGLVALSVARVTAVLPFLALAFGAGAASAIGTPAARALPPTLVPGELLESAMTLRSIAIQFGAVAGPALGGLLYPLSAGLVYGVAAGMCVAAACCVAAMTHTPAADGAAGAGAAPGLASVLGGIRFVRPTQAPFAAILLGLP